MCSVAVGIVYPVLAGEIPAKDNAGASVLTEKSRMTEVQAGIDYGHADSRTVIHGSRS